MASHLKLANLRLKKDGFYTFYLLLQMQLINASYGQAARFKHGLIQKEKILIPNCTSEVRGDKNFWAMDL